MTGTEGLDLLRNASKHSCRPHRQRVFPLSVYIFFLTCVFAVLLVNSQVSPFPPPQTCLQYRRRLSTPPHAHAFSTFKTCLPDKTIFDHIVRCCRETKMQDQRAAKSRRMRLNVWLFALHSSVWQQQQQIPSYVSAVLARQVRIA